MGLLSQFEERAERIVEGKNRTKLKMASIAKAAGKEMRREAMKDSSATYAPTLYNVLISQEDSDVLEPHLQSLSLEVESFLKQFAAEHKMTLDCPPLVRLIVDEGLRPGRFDVIAENVPPHIIVQLRDEEELHYQNLYGGSTSDEGAAPLSSDPNVFDPFVPSDMQSAVYVPLDAPAQSLQSLDYGDGEEPAAEEEAVEENAWQEEGVAPEHDEHGEDVCPDGASDEGLDAQLPSEPLAQGAEAALEAGAAAAAVGAMVKEPAAAGVAAAGAAAAASAMAPSASQSTASDKTTVMAGHNLPKNPCLVDLETGRSYPLHRPFTTFGRETNCHISIPDPSVSRHHGEIFLDGDIWIIRDTNSTNGTIVNGMSIAHGPLHDGDVIEVGDTRLSFREDLR